MKILKGKQIDYCIFSQWEWPWLVHGFTTKKGGLSKGYLAETNMKEHPEEEQKILTANRQLFKDELALKGKQLFFGEQIHSNKIAIIDGDSPCYMQGVDGLFTRSQGVNLMAFFADCLPVFFVIPSLPAVGLVHAGWRGSLLNISGVSLETIKKEWNLLSEDILVGFGPSIGSCCYEVNSEIKDHFLTQNKVYGQAFADSRQDHYWLDLQLINHIQLVECGVPEDNILHNRLCTACEKEFFYSHRRDNGLTGRMAGLIALA